MRDQGNRSMFFLIQLMFSDSQAKKFVCIKRRIILPVTKFFTDEILCRLFFPIRYESLCEVLYLRKKSGLRNFP